MGNAQDIERLALSQDAMTDRGYIRQIPPPDHNLPNCTPISGLGAMRGVCGNTPFVRETFPFSVGESVACGVARGSAHFVQKGESPDRSRGFLVWRCDTYNR